MKNFKLVSNYKPTGDQPQAIAELVEGIKEGNKFQTLLGVTGSGKTFTIANVIAQINKPTLVISHNKTLAAQLYGELKLLFPQNAVEYFISYYDYYQPEAYIPGRDIYIEKDADINSQIEKLRLHATMSLMERRDVVIVASVSCIYGLGIPEEYRQALVRIKVGDIIERDLLLKKLVSIHYGRNDISFERGAFRVHGDVVDIFPAYLEHSIRVEFFGDEIERITRINPLTNKVLEEVEEYPIYPANHFITSKETLEKAIASIKEELKERIRYFEKRNKLLEAQRIEQRTNFDLEMMREIGYCSGIENYSRHANQVDDLLEEIRKRIPLKQKILVTTLTKRMAEDLSQYLSRAGIKTRYLHSEIKTIERSKIIRDLRLGEFDVLVGINLLREGLDLPEVSLVAILDADKVGFLRSTRSLIQIAGRAARNVEGKVIFYAEKISEAMRETIEETNRRRQKQITYNEKNKITPASIKKNIDDIMASTTVAENFQKARKKDKEKREDFLEYLSLDSKEKVIDLLKKEMQKAADNLEFEKAAEIRDRIFELEGI
ncbi:MAG: hypothetical protein B6D62_01365 [Candidatus Cloacimonas sp. 4484_275]|nr:MAG: hypothetical protein B6D62_01365 [Candidatus Cloacimonas sp. 4484_275]